VCALDLVPRNHRESVDRGRVTYRGVRLYGGATMKQAIQEDRTADMAKVSTDLEDLEWEFFRKAQVRMFPRIPPAQFWPT
jgi:hypothetical protein